jgi:hypothetical protein
VRLLFRVWREIADLGQVCKGLLTGREYLMSRVYGLGLDVSFWTGRRCLGFRDLGIRA